MKRSERSGRSRAHHDDVEPFHETKATMACPGGVPERPKGTGCKPVGSAYGGSNPPAPMNIAPPIREPAFLHRSGVTGRPDLRGSSAPRSDPEKQKRSRGHDV